jgi:hypothetical protein
MVHTEITVFSISLATAVTVVASSLLFAVDAFVPLSRNAAVWLASFYSPISVQHTVIVFPRLFLHSTMFSSIGGSNSDETSPELN